MIRAFRTSHSKSVTSFICQLAEQKRGEFNICESKTVVILLKGEKSRIHRCKLYFLWGNSAGACRGNVQQHLRCSSVRTFVFLMGWICLDLIFKDIPPTPPAPHWLESQPPTICLSIWHPRLFLSFPYLRLSPTPLILEHLESVCFFITSVVIFFFFFYCVCALQCICVCVHWPSVTKQYPASWHFLDYIFSISDEPILDFPRRRAFSH